MPYSLAQYPGNGATTTFTVSFPFISRDHVTVDVSGVTTAFSWLTDGLILVSPAPANSTTVTISRNSSRGSRLVDYQDAATLTEADLDLANLQAIYIAQEAFDYSSLATVTGSIAAWAAAAQAAATAASGSATAAAGSATAASTSASNAAASAATAVAAAGSVTGKWALAAYNTVTSAHRANIDPNVTFDLFGSTTAYAFYVKPISTPTVSAGNTMSMFRTELTSVPVGVLGNIIAHDVVLSKTGNSSGNLYGFKASVTQAAGIGTGVCYGAHVDVQATNGTGIGYSASITGPYTYGMYIYENNSAGDIGIRFDGNGATSALNYGVYVGGGVKLNTSLLWYQPGSGATANLITMKDSTGSVDQFVVDKDGNMLLGGTGRRFMADMTSAAQVNRFLFQTSSVNGNSTLGVIPNGTASTAGFRVINNSAPTNSAALSMVITNATADISSGVFGTGTALPLTISTNGAERMRLLTTGELGIGTTVPLTRTHVSNATQTAHLLLSGGSAATGNDGGQLVFGTTGGGAATIAAYSAAGIQSRNTFGGETTGMSAHLDFQTNFRAAANTYTGLLTRMRIVDVGRVIVGGSTDDTVHTLQVLGNVVGNAFHPSVSIKTGTYTATVNDGVLLGNTTAGGFTITLPSAAAAGAGKSCTIHVRNIGTANTLTIAVPAGQFMSSVLNGTATAVGGVNYIMVSDGVNNWWTCT